MRASLFLFGCLFALSACQKAPDEEIEHFVEEVSTPEGLSLPRQDRLSGNSRGAIAEGVVLLDKVVNTGIQVWNIIERNRAVTKVSSLYATALPRGVGSGAELEGFSDLNQRSFRAHGKNPYGATVYDVEYTILHRHGGSYNGDGQYLDQVTILPTYVKALWGYTVDVTVTSSPPTNVGTSGQPIGALVMEVSLSVATVIKSTQQSRVFEFRGDSAEAKEVTAPASTRSLVKLVAANP